MPIVFKIFFILFLQQLKGVSASGIDTSVNQLLFVDGIKKNMTLNVIGDPSVTEHIVSICSMHKGEEIERDLSKFDIGQVRVRISFNSISQAERLRLIEIFQPFQPQIMNLTWITD